VGYKRKLTFDKLRQCAWIGGFRRTSAESSLCWLVSVPELQARGHIADVLKSDIFNEDYEVKMLKIIWSQDNHGPQRRHFLKYYDYWNNPDTNGFIDEIAPRAAVNLGRENYFWPLDADEMRPDDFLHQLRKHDYYV
jgi:hypothetical protein